MEETNLATPTNEEIQTSMVQRASTDETRGKEHTASTGRDGLPKPPGKAPTPTTNMESMTADMNTVGIREGVKDQPSEATKERIVSSETAHSPNLTHQECITSPEMTDSSDTPTSTPNIGNEETEQSDAFIEVRVQRKKTLLADSAEVSAPPPSDITGTVDFHTATTMIPPAMTHVEGYICSLADCQSIIAMIREDGKNIMVRVPATATIIGEKKVLRASTARIGHPIRLYQILKGQIEWKKQPTLSTIEYYCRLFSVVGPMEPTIPTIAAVADFNKFAKIVSGHTPMGMTTKQPMLVKGKMVPIVQGSVGTLLHAEAYGLPLSTKIVKHADCDIYTQDTEIKERDDPKAEPKLFALTNLRRLESKELNNIEQKCRNLRKPNLDELELWVGRASASLAAYHTFLSIKDNAEAKIVKPIDYHRGEELIASWKMENKCITTAMHEKFARGETIEVSFMNEKGRDSYVITAKITDVIVRRDDTAFIITFAPSDNNFLSQWTADAANTKRAVRMSPVRVNEKTHEVILSKFRQLPATKIGRQSLGRQPSQTNQAVITEEKRKLGSIRLDDSQAATLSRIVGSTGITITIAPPGSGKTALVAAVTREWITNRDCGRVIITGPTNVSVGNALEVLQATITSSEDIRTLRVASATAMANATKEEQKSMSLYKAQRFEEFINEENQRKDLDQLREIWLTARSQAEKVEEPTELIKACNAERVAKAELTRQFEEYFQPNVVATTTSLLLRSYNDATSELVTKMIIDESSMMRPSDFIAITCKFRKLESLVLIGDTAQLTPYLPTSENSDMYKCFAESDVSRLHKLHPQDSAKLTTVYRGHPDITRQLVAPNYPFPLEVGTSPDNRTLAKDLQPPTARSGSPIRFISVYGCEIDGENHDEADAIKRLVRTLLDRGLAPSDLLILTHHRNQLALLEKTIKDVPIKTIDAAQGQQAAVVIVATTKTAHGSDEMIRRTLRFISNPNRAMVAVSRAKEAAYIFGFLPQLERTEFWKPLIAISRKQGGITNDAPPFSKRRAGPGWTTLSSIIKRRND